MLDALRQLEVSQNSRKIFDVLWHGFEMSLRDLTVMLTPERSYDSVRKDKSLGERKLAEAVIGASGMTRDEYDVYCCWHKNGGVVNKAIEQLGRGREDIQELLASAREKVRNLLMLSEETR